VFVAVIVGYAIVTFGFQTVTVVGPSMNPTLADSQVVLVNKIVYKVSDVKRYDVIAYSRVDGDGYYDIKRVRARRSVSQMAISISMENDAAMSHLQ